MVNFVFRSYSTCTSQVNAVTVLHGFKFLASGFIMCPLIAHISVILIVPTKALDIVENAGLVRVLVIFWEFKHVTSSIKKYLELTFVNLLFVVFLLAITSGASFIRSILKIHFILVRPFTDCFKTFSNIVSIFVCIIYYWEDRGVFSKQFNFWMNWWC